MSQQNDIKYFLGSNTKRGFVPLFEQLRDPASGYRMVILKGGPGSGKSSLMRRIAKTLEENGHHMEYIPCASDPNSLDAILDYDAKSAIVDGTAPHTLDPKYPGAYDTIINLGDAWDSKALLQNKKSIMELSDEISLCHSLATTCIASAAALLDSNRRMAKDYVNYGAVQTFLDQLAEALKSKATGQERKRLLSAISVGEIVFFDDTLSNLCPKLYVISDEWGAASETLLSKLREYALEQKLDFITCYCSIQNPDKIDHLLFPSAGIGITTANSFHSTSYPTSIPMNGLMRPIDSYKSGVMKDHLSMAKKLIGTACEHVAYAKELHDKLEAYYITAMDFSKVDGIYTELTVDFLSK